MKNRRYYYSIFLALFAGISMGTNFLFHKIEIHITRELFQTIVDVFGEEKANEQLKRLFLVNMKAIEEIPYIKK